MFCQFSFTLTIATICIAGCLARPNGSNSVEINPEGVVLAAVQQDRPQEAGILHEDPPQVGNQMMNALKQAGMPTPQFFESLNNTAKAEFFNIKKNTTLTKGQMVSAIQNFIQSQPSQVQNQYNEWINNMNSWKNEMIAKIKNNLTGEPLALTNQIVGYMEDQSITNPETCKLIMGALKNVSHNITAEVRQAILANGIGYGTEVAGGPADMRKPGLIGTEGSGGMGGSMQMCASGGPQVMHDGPGGHFSGIHENTNFINVTTPATI